MKTLLTTLLLLSGALNLSAQSVQRTYTHSYEATLSGTAGVSTIQQPASPSKVGYVLAIQIYSLNACTVTIEAAGPASGTSTNGGPTSPGQTEVSTILHFADSNAVAPAKYITKVDVAAGQTVRVDFNIGRTDDKSNVVLGKTPNQNVTARGNCTTGTNRFIWLVRED